MYYLLFFLHTKFALKILYLENFLYTYWDFFNYNFVRFMRKLLYFFVFILLIPEVNAGNFVYPIDNVAVPKCRFTAWSELTPECKMALPKIVGGDYTKYKDNKDIRKIYSILWWATYNYWWDVWYWSHLWVDIATSAGTPIRSIWDWEVIIASWLSGRWNTVVIKHKLSDGKFIYSNYSHMSKIIVSKWNIRSWETIWEVWNTGNSYGNHLHFQIDITNQFHPYWYTKCSKWIDIMSVVNNWQCRDYLLSNTIDPILFLEGNWTYSSMTTSAIIQSIRKKQDETKKIEQKNIKTREEILNEEIDEFLKSHSFSYKTQVTWDNLKTNTKYITKLYVYNNWKPFWGNLPGNWIEFIYDKNVLSVSPLNLIVAEKNWREIFINSKKSWNYRIDFKLGKRIVFSKNINFYSPWELSSPTDALILTNTKWSIAIWDEKMWAIIMKTKFWTNQVYIPYDWTYKLKLISWKVKFCNISKNSKKICNPLDLSWELEFRYDDTKAWVLLFNFVALDYYPIRFTLQKVWRKYDISRTKRDILVKNPSLIDSSYTYYNENINAVKKWYIRLNKGYLLQDRELLGSQVKQIVNNYLSYEYLKSWDNYTKKNKIIQKIREAQTRMAIIWDYNNISRWEFTKIIFENLGINILKSDEQKFLDEKWFYKDYITTLRKNFNFKRKDQFWENYFQPDKNITIWEALFFVDKLSTSIVI